MAAVDLYRTGLPPPWRYAVCNDGRIFFINEETRTTTWLHPITGHPTNSGLFFSSDLPRGWEKDLTEQGRLFYVDHVNQKTHFQHPISGEFSAPRTPPPSGGALSPTTTGQVLGRDRGNSEGKQRKRSSSVKKNEKSRVVDKLPVIKRNDDSSISMQGWLHKQESKGLKHWKRRWFVLADFCLFYYRDHHEGQELGSILLPSYAISVCAKEDGITRKYAFKAEHQNMRTHYFAAENKEDMAHWMNALSLASAVQRDPNLERQYKESDDAGFISAQHQQTSPPAGYNGNRISGEWSSPPPPMSNGVDLRCSPPPPPPQQQQQYGPAWMNGGGGGGGGGGGAERHQQVSPYGANSQYPPVAGGFSRNEYPQKRQGPVAVQPQMRYENGHVMEVDQHQKMSQPAGWKQPRAHELRQSLMRYQYEDDDDGGFGRRPSAGLQQSGGEQRPVQAGGKPKGRSTQKELQDWYRNQLQRPSPEGVVRARHGQQPMTSVKKSTTGGINGRDADSHRYFEPLTIETGPVYENATTRHTPMATRHTPPATTSPGRPPLPAAYRGRYVQQLAADQTPRTQRDMMNSVQLSEQREHEQNYFRYPSNNPVQINSSPVTRAADNQNSQVPAASTNGHAYRQQTLPPRGHKPAVIAPPDDGDGVLIFDEGRRAAAEIGERERQRLQKYIDRSYRGENGHQGYRSQPLLSDAQADGGDDDDTYGQSEDVSLAAQMDKWNGMQHHGGHLYEEEDVQDAGQIGTQLYGSMDNVEDDWPEGDGGRYDGDQRTNWDEDQLVDWQTTARMNEHIDENENVVGKPGLLREASARRSYIELSPTGRQSLDRLQQETRVSLGSPGPQQVAERDGLWTTTETPSSRAKPQLTPLTTQSLGESFSQVDVPVSTTTTTTRPSRPHYNIDTIPENPDQMPSDIIETKLPPSSSLGLHGNLAGLRLSVCASDLIGKSHEELVLLLIELRRNQARLEAAKVYYTQQLDSERSFIGDGENDSPAIQELCRQKDYVQKELEVHKPLVNLLDNLVTMGSLYGGDNLMLASQYKKDRLKPHQYATPKPLIEFSRHHQEEQVARAHRDRAVSEDEADLEEKLQRLYASDRTLQEKSLAITSLQQDKHLLEKALAETRNDLDSQPQQSVTWRHLVQQLRGIELKLLHVRQQLADESKKMEEAAAENSRLEHEVVALRSKVLGLNKSLNSPSVKRESLMARRQLEGEVHGITSIISGLSQQGEQLSQVMNSLARGQPVEPTSNVVESKPSKVATYVETDMDTGLSMDISLGHHPEQHQSPQTTSLHRTPAMHNIHQEAPDVLRSGSAASGLTRQPFPSPSRRIDDLPTSQVQPHMHDGAAPYWQPMESTGMAPPRTTDRLEDESDEEEEEEEEAEEMGGYISRDFSDADENTKRFYGLIPRERLRSQTVRDVKKKESARRGRERSRNSIGTSEQDHQQEAAQVSTFQPARRSRSLPRRQSSQDSAGEGDSHYESTQFYNEPSQFKRSYSAREAVVRASRNSSGAVSSQSASARLLSSSSSQRVVPHNTRTPSGGHGSNSDQVRRMSDLFTPRPFKRADTLPASSRVESLPSQVPTDVSSRSDGQAVAAVKPMPVVSKRQERMRERRSAGSRYQTISGTTAPSVNEVRKQPAMQTAAGDLITSALLRPEKVDIPERYVPDSDDGVLTEDERRFHDEKAKKLRKLLAAQSLQDWSQGELRAGTAPGWGTGVAGGGEIHEQLNEEKRRREQVLDMRQVLAREVMEKSRQVAVTKRQSNTVMSSGEQMSSPDRVAERSYVAVR